MAANFSCLSVFSPPKSFPKLWAKCYKLKKELYFCQSFDELIIVETFASNCFKLLDGEKDNNIRNNYMVAWVRIIKPLLDRFKLNSINPIIKWFLSH